MLRPNTSLLAETASSTKGKAVSKPSEIFRPVELQGKSLSELWPIFILLSILVLPIDIATRRIVVPIKELLQTRNKNAVKAEETLPIQGLKGAKQRVQAKTSIREKGPTTSAGILSDVKVQTPQRQEQQAVVPVPTEPMTGSTASALLAKKRNRTED